MTKVYWVHFQAYGLQTEPAFCRSFEILIFIVGWGWGWVGVHWGGLGWGGLITFMLRCCQFSCTSIHRVGWCGVGKLNFPSLEPTFVKSKEWRKKWLPLRFWVVLRECHYKWAPNILEKTLTQSNETLQKWWLLWDEIKGQEQDPLKRGFDKQPGGMFNPKPRNCFFTFSHFSIIPERLS